MKRGRGRKCHPTVEDHVVIGTGATILGPLTIGAQALVLDSLPADSIVLGHAGSIIYRSAEHTITTVDQAVNDWVV
jgi:serine O-acetyltransferase